MCGLPRTLCGGPTGRALVFPPAALGELVGGPAVTLQSWWPHVPAASSIVQRLPVVNSGPGKGVDLLAS